MIWNRNKSVCEEFLAQYSDASSVVLFFFPFELNCIFIIPQQIFMN